jgi:Xaa-Pro aminopeptidase
MPHIKIRDVDVDARTVIANADYEGQFPHRIGHGLGMDIQ